jgi:hypothetical protein
MKEEEETIRRVDAFNYFYFKEGLETWHQEYEKVRKAKEPSLKNWSLLVFGLHSFFERKPFDHHIAQEEREYVSSIIGKGKLCSVGNMFSDIEHLFDQLRSRRSTNSKDERETDPGK